MDKLEAQLLEASNQPDPALWLYQNGARTPLFMLEGLARLYSNLHDKKLFSKVESRAKSLEDALGVMDYYDGFAKEFASDDSISSNIIDFTRSRLTNATGALNALLIKDKWVGPEAQRIRKMRKKLAKVEWLDDKRELKEIESYYLGEVEKINRFAAKYADGFTALESQVHELRRKLRWLSIFPQALRGAIQLTDQPSNEPLLAKYLSPEITDSPFNKMPPAGDNEYILLLNRDNFYALSWMIAELGKLKDSGLRTELLAEAGGASREEKRSEAEILRRSSSITNTYFTEGSLDHLVSGVKKRGH
ncbi:MAG: hypothetical protein JO053_01365 [Acidobacteria bacterium]|nr:hypothetical protein [Acidobacteriota bacterium]